MRLSEIIRSIERRKVVLPEFQREYVWNRELSRQLLISMIKQYPVGSLLYWETSEPPILKNISREEKQNEPVKVLIDGQQRLTTLYMFIKGEVPPYYLDTEISEDPRNLFFNLETSFFEYYQQNKMEGNPMWQRVTDCFLGKVDIENVISKLTVVSVDKNNLRKRFRSNISRLLAIQEHDFVVEKIDGNWQTDQVVDVFDRVNSYGVSFTSSELVLTHIVTRWPKVRREMKSLQEELEVEGFQFDLDFLTRCMVVGLTHDSSYREMSNYQYSLISEVSYVEVWEKVSTSLKQVVQMLKKEGFVDSLGQLSSEYLLIPIVAYLLKWGSFPNKRIRRGMLYWLFLAHIWRRYQGLFLQRLHKDVYIVTHLEHPVEMLTRQIEEYRGRTRIRSGDIEGQGVGHPLHKMLFTLVKWKEGEDWVNKSAISKTTRYEDIYSQHIFPQSLLYKDLYAPESYLDRKKVNEIANRAFLTSVRKYDFSQSAPSKYLSGFSVQMLESQVIPVDPALWQIENYENFLETRRRLIAQEINGFLASFGYQPHGLVKVDDYTKLIELGENNYIEFKALLRADPDSPPHRSIEYQVAKTLAAFLNSGGGILMIGIMNDGRVRGIEQDYEYLGSRKNKDGFYLYLTQVVNKYLGKDINAFLSTNIVEIEGKDVCVIEAAESSRPVYIDKNGEKRFYIRAAASSEPLDARERQEYIKTHW